MSEYIIAAVPLTLAEYIWKDVVPHLQRVVDKAHGEITCDSVKQRILSGDVLLIVITKHDKIIAVNTVEVRVFDSGVRALFIPITGGDELDGWMEQFLDVANHLAIEQQCTEIRGIAVRKGWLRKLKTYGWEEVSTTISKSVEL